MDYIKNEKVKLIVKSANCLIEIYDPKLTEYDHLKYDALFKEKKALGLYDGISDKIFINKDILSNEEQLNMTILHEIGHWTGNKERLSRVTLYDNQRRGTEEVTAQACYFYLSRYFEIDANSTHNTKSYVNGLIQMWPKLNTKQGFKRGLEAAKYIINLVENN